MFEINSDEVNEPSYVELNRITELMKRKPALKIEIIAHTDDTGSENYNLELSKNRTMSIKNFLVENEIVESRIKTEGEDENFPKVPNTSKENRAKNRRVKLKIIDL